MIALRLPSHFPVRATEWMLAAIMASFGLVLLLPGYDVFGSSASFDAMARLTPQRVWGTIALLLGVAHLTALYVNGTKRKSPHLRAFCSGAGVLFWFQVLLGFGAAGNPTTAWAVYPWLLIFSIRNVVVAMQDARKSDDRSRAVKELIGGSN